MAPRSHALNEQEDYNPSQAMEGFVLGACLGMISLRRIDERLSSVRARIAELEQARATGTNGTIVIELTGELRQLKDEEAFLEVLAS
jgi:hypothetical protein